MSTTYAIEENGVIYNSPGDLSNMWAEYYRVLLNENDDVQFDNDHKSFIDAHVANYMDTFSCTNDNACISTDNISVHEVAQVWKGIQNGKSQAMTLSHMNVKNMGVIFYLSSLHNFIIV